MVNTVKDCMKVDPWAIRTVGVTVVGYPRSTLAMAKLVSKSDDNVDVRGEDSYGSYGNGITNLNP